MSPARPEVTGKSLAGKLADTLADGGWRAKARPEQLLPQGDWWNGFLYCGGRGTGKTRAVPKPSRNRSKRASPGTSRLLRRQQPMRAT
jgi:phage terminase large subunit-like protein